MISVLRTMCAKKKVDSGNFLVFNFVVSPSNLRKLSNVINECIGASEREILQNLLISLVSFSKRKGPRGW